MCTARCTWRACAGGSTCDAPRDAPSSVQAQPQPASLGCVSRPQVCRRAGSGAGPLRLCARALVFAGLKSRLHRATSRLLVRPEERKAVPPMKPPRGRAEPGPRRRRGRTGSPPRGDVGSLSRRAALATAFPSRRVSGGRPLPFSFFLNGVLGGGGRKRRADPAPVRFRQPLLSEPRFPSSSLPHALDLHFGVTMIAPWGCWSVQAEGERGVESIVMGRRSGVVVV